MIHTAGYQALGWRVVPIHTDSKTPTDASWPDKEAFDDTGWTGNWGVVCGSASGLVVVDVDCKFGKQGKESLQKWERLHGFLPPTLSATTPSGGKHYFFAVSKDRTYVASRRLMGPDIDVQGDRTLVIVEPSVLVSANDSRTNRPQVPGSYKWDNWGTPVAPLPESLVQALGEIRRDDPGQGLLWPSITEEDQSYRARLELQKRLLREAPLLLEGEGNDRYVFLFQRVGPGLRLDQETTFQSYREVYDPRLPEAHQWLNPNRYCEEELRHTIWRAYHRPMQNGVVPDQTWQMEQARFLETKPAAPEPTVVPAAHGRRFDPLRDVILDKKSKIGQDAVTQILSMNEWENVLRYDEFSGRVRAHNPPLDMDAEKNDVTTTDYIRIQQWFAYQGFSVPLSSIETAVDLVSQQQKTHAVRQYLNELPPWDKVSRVDSWLIEYGSVEVTDFARVAGAKWLISAVARAFEPACQADSMLIVEGVGGIGKSKLFQHLTPGFFSDTPINLDHHQDAYQALRGAWIVIFDEMVTNRTDARRLRNFVTSRVDNYRPSYGKRVVAMPRQCVFCGTTNYEKYFHDSEGLRRFWPVKATGLADISGLIEARDQLWAETLHRYRAGEPWYMSTPDEQALATAAQEERVVDDVYQDKVLAYVKGKSAVTTVKVLEHLFPEDIAVREQRQASIRATLYRICGPAKMKYYEGRKQSVYTVPEALQVKAVG